MSRITGWVPVAAALLASIGALAIGAVTEVRTQPASKVSLPANLARGQRTFLENCAMCHGNGGQGDGELAAALHQRARATVANLTDRAEIEKLGRSRIRDVIAKGGAHTGRSNLMPAWGERLSRTELDDVAAYVANLPSMTPSLSSATLNAYLETPVGAPRAGREIFVHQCSACHGLGGRGDGPLAQSLELRRHVRPRNLTDSTFAASKSDRDLYMVISEGGGAMGKSVYMPHWGGYLTAPQIKDVISYVRVISHTVARP